MTRYDRNSQVTWPESTWKEIFCDIHEMVGARGWLYMATFFAWLVVGVIPNYREASVVAQGRMARFYETVPDVPAAEVQSRLKVLETYGSKVSEDPRVYWKFLKEAYSLRTSCNKGMQGGDVRYARCQLALGGFGIIDGVQRAYNDRFGRQRMSEVAETERLNFDPFSEPNPPLGSMFKGWFLSSLPFALFFFLLRLDACGFSVLFEVLGRPWRLALATLLWPIGIFKYPTGEPAEQLGSFMRLAAATLATCISCFAGNAVAAENKPEKKEKKQDRWALQMDLRNSLFTGDGPTHGPEQFGRLTVISPSGWLVESLNVRRPGFFLDASVVGHRMVRTQTLTVYGVTGAIFTSSGSQSVQGGFQAFFSAGRWSVGVPTFYVEHQIKPTSTTTFSFTSFPGYWLNPKVQVGAQVDLRVPDGQPVQWGVGPRITRRLSQNSLLEAAVLANRLGDRRLRVRWIQTFLPHLAPTQSREETEKKPAFTVVANTGIVSRYMAILGPVASDEVNLRQDVTLQHRSGIYANMWRSYGPRGGLDSDFGDETDFAIGFQHGFKKYTLDMNYTYVDLYPMFSSREDVHALSATVAHDGHRVVPYVRVDTVLPRNKEAINGGWVYRAGGRTVIKRCLLDLSLSGHDGIFNGPPEQFGSLRLKVARDVKLGRVVATPSWTIQRKLQEGNVPDKSWWGLNLAYGL